MKAPLRIVVERWPDPNDHGAWFERLECGHLYRHWTMLHGMTINAKRRRCKECQGG